jgi:hypothetical protein
MILIILKLIYGSQQGGFNNLCWHISEDFFPIRGVAFPAPEGRHSHCALSMMYQQWSANVFVLYNIELDFK